MTPSDKQDLWRRMKVPTAAVAGLLVMLAANVALSEFATFSGLWLLQLAVAFAMIVVVLLFSMEVLHEPPLMRLFSVLGFCWLAILFAMTLIDYLTRTGP